MIGDTLADPNDPRPLPPLTVDEPSISITIGINTSVLAGRSGKKLTARLIKNRLDQELVGNVSVRMLPTDRPDTWEMQGRGELALRSSSSSCGARSSSSPSAGRPSSPRRSTASCTSRSSG